MPFSVREYSTVGGIIGSWNERFSYAEEDIDAYLTYAEKNGYRHIYLAGHSLGANKVLYYLSRTHDARVESFAFLSPANLTYMTSDVTPLEAWTIQELVKKGAGDQLLPFLFMGWVQCVADAAYDWYYGGLLNNVHTDRNGDFSQAAKITHRGALFVGSYDTFTDGDPVEFLKNLNDHMPTAKENKLIVIEKTGHTYQGKRQEIADALRDVVCEWREEVERDEVGRAVEGVEKEGVEKCLSL